MFRSTLLLLFTATTAFFSMTQAQNSISPYGPKVRIPTQKNSPLVAPVNPKDYQHKIYPWHKNITATIFWVGELPTPNNPTPNTASSWDTQWARNFGGYDDPNPSARRGFLPRSFTPKENPFYVALPYNDCVNHRRHRPEAHRYIPWFKRTFTRPGLSICKGRWVQIQYRGKSCYAQWEDCGPFHTDDYSYVFGTSRPKNTKNNNAGIDLSPAVRDFLKLKSGAKVHWRFIEFAQVPKYGPWTKWGSNNPFVNKDKDPDQSARIRYYEYLRQKRDQSFRKRPFQN